MKSYVSLITLLFSFVVFAPNWLLAAPSHGEVLRVLDGDTVSFQTQSGKKLRVRLADIDAPELDQPWGPAAKTALEIWAEGKSGSIEIVDTDSYGRKVAYLYVNDKNINERLISEGLAWVYMDYLRDRSFISFQRDAISRQEGLWSSADPIQPSIWRSGKIPKSSPSAQTEIVLGVVKKSRSNICHAPGTTYYSRTTNFQAFDSLRACLSSGGRLPKR